MRDQRNRTIGPSLRRYAIIKTKRGDLLVKTTIKEQSAIEYVIAVEIPAEIVDRKLEEIYRRVVRTLEVPGFRRGHIPRSFLEMRFGKDFLYEDSQAELIEEYLPQALSQHNIEPASRPEPRIVEFEAGKPFLFEVEVEVFPEVELGDYSQIEVEAPKRAQVTQEEIEEVIEELRIEHATLVPKGKEAPAEAEDVVVVRRANGETHELQVRSDGWTKALLDKRVGDSLELELPEGAKERVIIDGIKKIELPDLEELAQTLGHEDLDSFREDLRRRLEERSEQEHEEALRLAALDALIERSRVVVPPGLVEQLFEREVNHLKEGGHEPSKEEQSELKEALKRRLRRERVLQTLKESEGLKLSDEEFEEYLKEEAERREINPVKFKALLEREGQLEILRRERERQKVLDFLIKNVKIKGEGG